MNKMFNKIKKKHSESFAKAMRDNHPAILDIPNLDSIIKYSGSDSAIFPYLYSLTQSESYSTSNEYDYIDLFNKAGYQVEHTTTVESFLKYKTHFKKNELLCSFNDIQNRLNNFICLWAVKHNVSEIKRNKAPTRQDGYGTSVICIQISKTSNFISIKNRYNHGVTNPDNTFNSNPDNIIDGLSSAIEKHFNVSFKKDVSIPEGFTVIGDKIIKVLNELDGVYFGINCYIKNGEFVELNTDYEYLFDTYVLNIKDKKIYNLLDVDDCFVDIINGLLESDKVYIENKTIYIGKDSIVLNEYNQIIGLSLNSVENIGNDFLFHNKELRELCLDSVESIGNNFLFYNNTGIRELSLNNVGNIGNDFLYTNIELRELTLNNVKNIGDDFLNNNTELRELSLNSVETIGDCFLCNNMKLRELHLDNVKNIGDDFLNNNTELRELSLNNVGNIGNDFLYHNDELRELHLDNVKNIGDDFLCNNMKLIELSLNNVGNIGNDFLYYNMELRELHLDNVKNIGDDFLYNNIELIELHLDNVTNIGNNFLFSNIELRDLTLDNVKNVGHDFLYYNKELREKIKYF